MSELRRHEARDGERLKGKTAGDAAIEKKESEQAQGPVEVEESPIEPTATVPSIEERLANIESTLNKMPEQIAHMFENYTVKYIEPRFAAMQAAPAGEGQNPMLSQLADILTPVVDVIKTFRGGEPSEFDAMAKEMTKSILSDSLRLTSWNIKKSMTMSGMAPSHMAIE